jgi:lysophospholipase L1-like esterase
MIAVLGLLLVSPLSAGAKIRVACVGDSITYGHPVVYKHPEKTYPAVLGKLLGEKYDVRNFGCNSATLVKIGNKPYVKQPAFKKATEFNPHIVIIKLGTNDTKVDAWMEKKQFVGDLKELVSHFRGLRAKPVVFLGIPVPVSPKRTRGITAPEVRDRIIPMIRRVAKEEKVPLIDFHTPLANRLELLPDTIHPNAKGYAIMAAAAHAELIARGRKGK